MDTQYNRLTDDTITHATDILIQREPAFGEVVGRFGYPPVYGREPGFATLLHIILEQQVSLASALAAFNKLQAAVGELTPTTFLALDDQQLRDAGFSRQKTRYGRILAQAVLSGQLNLDELPELDDDDARAKLVALTGIGNWTADVYLMMVLRRVDIWPIGDRALVVAARDLLGLADYPKKDEMIALGERWRPWRSVASHLLWFYYLSR